MPDVVGSVSSPPLITHVIYSLATGGLENGVVNLVNAGGPEFRHAIVCLSSAGSMRDRLKAGVEVISLGKRRGHDLGAVRRLVGVLRRMRPAIVHSRNWAAFDGVPAARLAGVPVVVHGEHGRDVADPHGRNLRRKLARRILSPLVTRFVTVSRDLERWLVEDVRIPARKVLSIHNGVDLARFGERRPRVARETLKLPSDAVVVGTVGRLDPVKDQAGLIRSFATVLAEHPEAYLIIAGDGPCREDLTRLAVDLGVGRRVRLLGDCPDVPLVLSAMDLFVLPSIAEGMSNTVLEAMAAGLPVIATGVGGNPELVEEGTTGRLVPPQQAAALTAAMAAYLDDPNLRTLHGKASRQRATEHFALTRMCDAYTSLYTSLVSSGAAGGR